MKARNILTALVKDGIIKRSFIDIGKQIMQIVDCIDEGLVHPEKTYLCLFDKISDIEHSAIVITEDREEIYLYEI